MNKQQAPTTRYRSVLCSLHPRQEDIPPLTMGSLRMTGTLKDASWAILGGEMN